MMKAGYGAARNASIPSLVSTQSRPGVFAKRAGLAAIPVVAGTTAGIMQGGNKARQEGTYMANPMMGKSHNPSYNSAMTREGQIQTMMEEMDGMNLSEEAKRQIIQDKLGIDYGYLENQFDKSPEGMKAEAFYRIATDPTVPMDQRITAALRRETGAAFSPEEEIVMRARLKQLDDFRETQELYGSGVTPNEMKMFMGIPQ